jgi:hypothetical protein
MICINKNPASVAGIILVHFIYTELINCLNGELFRRKMPVKIET